MTDNFSSFFVQFICKICFELSMKCLNIFLHQESGNSTGDTVREEPVPESAPSDELDENLLDRNIILQLIFSEITNIIQ